MNVPPRRGHIAIDAVGVDFESRGTTTNALSDVSLKITSGQFVALIGPSGCGKSTLLNIVAGFVAPTRGGVALDGAPITRAAPDRGVVFQQPTLFPWKTVRENIALGPRMAGKSPKEVRRITDHFMELVGLSKFADHHPDALSGGMQQRVGIARTLANNPSVLLMDEPFGALDAQTRELMQESLLQLWEKNRTTLLFVTHDIEEAVFLADRVVIMSARPGRIIADLAVDIPRPRTPDVLDGEAFREIKRHCRELIRGESIKAFAQQGGDSAKAPA